MGTYRWVASYSGDANNAAVAGACSAANETIVDRPAPTLATTPSSRMTVGSSQLTDSVVVNGRFSPSAAATIDFRLYGPDVLTCGGTPVHEALGVLYPAAGGAVTSSAFTPQTAGRYRWVVSYSGDANNPPAQAACGAANETIVDRASPALVTTASPGIRVGLGSLADSAAVVGRVNPQPGSTLDFTIFGPDDPSCSGPVAYHLPSLAYPAAGAPAVTTSPAFTPVLAGTYRWRVSYSGDVNNAGAASACGDPSQTIAVTPGLIAGGDADADGDGYPARVDCDDGNRAIHPNADDKPGNGVDEDCDRADARYPRLETTILLTTQRRPPSRSLRLTRLVIRPALAGSTLRLQCAGGSSCRGFKSVSRRIAKRASSRGFSALLPRPKLLPGARFEVRVTMPGTIGRVHRLSIFARKREVHSNLCLAPGASKPSRCPT